jgi:hypothetical protein
MCLRDEADLLPEVLEHLDGELDALYAYDDGSIDTTLQILDESKVVTDITTRASDVGRLSIARPHYHALLEKIKRDYLGCDEPVWVFITMGDRFFLNKKPRQIAEEAEAGGYTTVTGIQLDFLRHRAAPWTEENDTFPDYAESLRKICKWFKFDEECIVAYRLSADRSYIDAKYPWPRGGHTKVQYSQEELHNKLSLEMPFLEHQGRRSPNAFKWRTESGSRKLSSKIHLSDMSFDVIKETQCKWYNTFKLCPWINTHSLDWFVTMCNSEEWQFNAKKLTYWEPLEAKILANGPHEREDL